MSRPRYLTKSRFRLATECPTKLFYTGKQDIYPDKAIENTFLAALAEGGFQVGELAKAYFPTGHTIQTLDYETPAPAAAAAAPSRCQPSSHMPCRSRRCACAAPCAPVSSVACTQPARTGDRDSKQQQELTRVPHRGSCERHGPGACDGVRRVQARACTKG